MYWSHALIDMPTYRSNEVKMKETDNPIWHGMVAGGCAAIVSRVFTYPPDTVKARLQVQEGRRVSQGTSVYLGTVDAFGKIAKQEGIHGFYRGFGSLLLTVIPANMCYFSGYEFGRKITPKNWGVGSDVITAIVAQTLAGIAYCPIDIVKQTVQTANVTCFQGSNHGATSSITPLQATREIWQTQGIRGFYRGFTVMNILWMPWNLIYLTTYEASKRSLYEWELDKIRGGRDMANRMDSDGILHSPTMTEVLPAWAYPLCSSSCSALAAIATHPIDVVKTRIQVYSARTGVAPKAMDVTKELWEGQGFQAFGRGLGARILTMSMGTSISWFVYEMTKSGLNKG